MMPLSPLMRIAGTLLMVGGLGAMWASVRALRQGQPWRGDGLTSVAMTVYGGLTLTGVVFNGTATGAVIAWTAAAATFAGLWIARRERRVTSR